MLKGFDENGVLRDVKVTEDGKVLVSMSNDSGSGDDSSIITESVETTLYAGVLTLNTQAQTIGVQKKVTEISIANYSETANVAVNLDESEQDYIVAPGISLDLPINKVVGIVGLSATEANTKVQYIIKGVE